jgi:hypothetical protein
MYVPSVHPLTSQVSHCTRTVFALIVINKAGGLIYNKNFHEGLNRISTNDYLVLAGTFHG